MSTQHMALPPLFTLVRVIAELSASMGCLIGGSWIIVALNIMEYSVWGGVVAMLPGAGIVAGSLSGLGIMYALLATVRAIIDMRNATVLTQPGSSAPRIAGTGRSEPWLE